MEEKSINNSHIGNAEGIIGNQKVCEDLNPVFVKEEIKIEETLLSEENNSVDNAEHCKEIKHENVKIENRINEESSKEFVPVLVKKDPLHLDQDNEIKTEIKEEQQDASNEEVLDQEDDSDGSFKDDEVEEEEMNESSTKTNKQMERFKCQFCDYNSMRKHVLKKHITTMHYHKCNLCDFKADSVANIKGHIAISHPKEKNYACEICAYATFKSSKLKYHIENVHHKVKTLKCEHCDFATSYITSLKKHVKRAHFTEQCERNVSVVNHKKLKL